MGCIYGSLLALVELNIMYRVRREYKYIYCAYCSFLMCVFSLTLQVVVPVLVLVVIVTLRVAPPVQCVLPISSVVTVNASSVCTCTSQVVLLIAWGYLYDYLRHFLKTNGVQTDTSQPKDSLLMVLIPRLADPIDPNNAPVTSIDEMYKNTRTYSWKSA